MRPTFHFNRELGSEGATATRTGEHAWHIHLAVSPYHDGPPRWVNRCQFHLETGGGFHAPIEVTVGRPEEVPYWFNEYALSLSSDGGVSWSPLHWESSERGRTSDCFTIPPSDADELIIGNQVPMSGHRVAQLNAEFARHPDVTRTVIGQSREGRPIERLTIATPGGRPLEKRSVHYVANHHPGEGNACWRNVGWVRWLLSAEASPVREHSVFHILLMASPDSPAHGWSRCNGEGWDMNRCFRPEGADAQEQGTEPYVIQKDFEALMDSESPVTACWLCHTWGGRVAPFLLPGPELAALGGIEAYQHALSEVDEARQFEPIGHYTAEKAAAMPTNWNTGPFLRWGITCGLVEGSGGIIHQSENIKSGATLGRAMAKLYRLS